MSEFNFSLNDSQVSSNSSNYFKPYTINDIDSIKVEYANGTSSTGKEWNAIDIIFTGKEGQHKERYFLPANDEEGITRPTFNTSNGGKTEIPAPYEILKQLAIHVLGIYAPSQFEKFKVYCTKVKNMKQFLDGFVKLVNDAPKKETKLKVVGRNSNGTIYARLPRTCGIVKDKDGNFTSETYPINFLGDNLTFTAYEMGEKAKLTSAKPTNMDDNLADSIDSSSKGSEDIDLSSLL